MAQTIKNKSEPGFFIEMSCPGCGGELQIGDDFFKTIKGVGYKIEF